MAIIADATPSVFCFSTTIAISSAVPHTEQLNSILQRRHHDSSRTVADPGLCSFAAHDTRVTRVHVHTGAVRVEYETLVKWLQNFEL